MIIQSSVSRRCALLVCALVGVAFGCAGKTKPGGWFDACCDDCTGDHCTGCDERKGACGGESIAAQCLHHDEGLMCRRTQQSRH